MNLWDDYTSIALTPLAIVVCMHLIYHWWYRAIAFIKGNREPLSYIGLGVVIYHAGTILDNTYWDAAWASLITQHKLQPYFFDYGSLANIIFRQGAVILGGYFQIVGVMKFHNDDSGMSQFYKHSMLALIFGLSQSLYLFMVAS
jgi:hypothetical protein